ncbi:hypothetical protein [Defluviimonas sp. WL0075]|uniref:Uncharacterized protein n=1 Tax=Albidovulum sediminicola TaxID=2984331 RepID=A0ABT2YZY1_9RHOB|nr:hypothetical protein [Defluviimonas sp. WL0075]MCV2864408.1 hypothetical protein [Defluviimonas sp. WL0075]
MATAGALVFDEQFRDLKEIASARPWQLDDDFVFGLTARDGETYWLKVDCTDYPALPPAWHWYSPESKAIDQPADSPKGSGFLHGSGRICAPWNRLAYKKIDPQGPHDDWDLNGWQTNPKTGRCTTLAAMALRIHVELNSKRYQGRMR